MMQPQGEPRARLIPVWPSARLQQITLSSMPLHTLFDSCLFHVENLSDPLSAVGLSGILSPSDPCSSAPRIQEFPLLQAAKENDLCVLKKLLLDRNCDFRQRGGTWLGVTGGGPEAPARLTPRC